MDKTDRAVLTILIIVALTGIFIVFQGCSAVQFRTPIPTEPQCIDVAKYPNSIILKQLENPCEIHEALVILAQTGIVMDSWTYEVLHNHLVAWVHILSVVDEISAKKIKDEIIKKIALINNRIAAGMWIVSSAFMQISDDTIFKGEDLKVLVLSLKDIDRRAKEITVFQ